jgi:hypothetical protein
MAKGWRQPSMVSNKLNKYSDSDKVRRRKTSLFQNLIYIAGLLSISANLYFLINGLNPSSTQKKTFAETIVGAWKLERCEGKATDRSTSYLVAGKDPAGLVIFGNNGRFSVQEIAEIPKFLSGDRMQGTSDENKAVVSGLISYFGNYQFANNKNKINAAIERSSFPNQNRSTGTIKVELIPDGPAKFDFNWDDGANTYSCYFNKLDSSDTIRDP